MVIYIKHNNSDEFNIIQKVLFSLGYQWYSTILFNDDYNKLRPYYMSDTLIVLNLTEKYFSRGMISHENEVINLNGLLDLIDNNILKQVH